MRNLVFALLLANLLLLAWQRWVVAPDAPPSGLSGDPAVPKLVLLDRPRPAAGVPADQSGPAGAVRCTRMGPFGDSALADRIATQLTGRGMSVARSEQLGEVWVGHWVQLAGLGSRADAETALNRLNKAGIRDAYIVRADTDYRISLGVFRSADGAERLAATARQAGFTPLIQDRFRDGIENWLKIEHPAGQAPRLGDLEGVGSEILRAEPVPCVAADGGAATDSLQ